MALLQAFSARVRTSVRRASRSRRAPTTPIRLRTSSDAASWRSTAGPSSSSSSTGRRPSSRIRRRGWSSPGWPIGPTCSRRCSRSRGRPSSDQTGSFQAWQVYELGDPRIRLDLTAIALAEGEVIGYTTFVEFGEERTGAHRVLTVLPAWGGTRSRRRANDGPDRGGETRRRRATVRLGAPLAAPRALRVAGLRGVEGSALLDAGKARRP